MENKIQIAKWDNDDKLKAGLKEAEEKVKAAINASEAVQRKAWEDLAAH